MGIETLIIGGLIGASALGSMSAAQKQAKANAQEGEIKTKELAKRTRYLAAEREVAFLNSGVTLEGTPMTILNETYDTGIADINQLRANYNAKSKSLIAKGRSEAIQKIVGGAMMAGAGSGMGNMFESADFGFATGGQDFFNGGFGNMVGAAQGKQGPGF